MLIKSFLMCHITSTSSGGSIKIRFCILNRNYNYVVSKRVPFLFLPRGILKFTIQNSATENVNIKLIVTTFTSTKLQCFPCYCHLQDNRALQRALIMHLGSNYSNRIITKYFYITCASEIQRTSLTQNTLVLSLCEMRVA